MSGSVLYIEDWIKVKSESNIYEGRIALNLKNWKEGAAAAAGM